MSDEMRVHLLHFAARTGLRLASTLVLAASGSGAPARADELPLLTPPQAAATKGVNCVWSGNGRDSLSLTVSNGSGNPVEVSVPAGQVAQNLARTARMIVLRAAQFRVPAHGSAEASLPAAALSSNNAMAKEPFVPVAETESRLEPLLKFLSNQPDAPKETAQLMVFCVLEDISFEQWEKFLASQRTAEPSAVTDPAPGGAADALTHGAGSAPPTARLQPAQVGETDAGGTPALLSAAHPTPARVTQAIDALGILRTIAPDKKFALANDSGLKLRALRNPWCRAKAMQLYGIALPASSGADGQVPDLGQLLHTKPGDNCPICRQRSLMQQGGSDF